MKKEKLVVAKKVALKNNCPECFSTEGLELTFKQKFVETTFYKSITTDISNEIKCHKCNCIIYPERWTDDIERVFEYQQKAFTPKPASKYFKKLFWIILITALVVIALITLAVIYTATY